MSNKYARVSPIGDIIEIFELPWGEITDHFPEPLARQFIPAPDDISYQWKYVGGEGFSLPAPPPPEEETTANTANTPG